MIKLRRALFIFWIYTLLVILWGAWVRISHSGDGCGDHWPMCAGTFLPDLTQTKTFIEYSHRVMTGIFGIIVFYFFIQLRKAHFTKLTRNLNLFLLILMVTEALLGALLVKGQLVTTNDSFYRLITMIFHQLNSFLLTGVTFALYLSIKSEPRKLRIKAWLPLLLFVLIPISGAIASLSVTLFPSISVLEGIIQDFAVQSHPFIRLRIIHPLFGILFGGGLMVWLFLKDETRAAGEFLVAIAIGAITLATLSPVSLKLSHLLIAHLLWARLIYLFVNSPDSSKR